MNYCAVQQQNDVASREEMSNRDPVVCPKPRRPGLLNAAVSEYPLRTFRWHLTCQVELCDSNSSGSDPFDTVLTKGDCVTEQLCCPEAASSPPFFCGSPPSRVANPLIQDARFGDEKLSPLMPSSPSSSARKGGCVRANFGNNPAVRIEGFDCLDRDSRNCSIPALA